MKQLGFGFASRRRPRRGRPRLSEEERRRRGSWVPRVARPEIKASHPLHVTLRAAAGVPPLRAKKRFQRVRDALRAGAERHGMRVVHFCVLADHVHLIVEAHDKRALSRGMQGLAIRIAKAVNRHERTGKVFRDRYHAAALDNPKRVRAAIAYVLLNARRHAARREALGAAALIDPYSSGYWFDGWSGDVERLRRAAAASMDFAREAPTAAPRTWLLGVGWRRHRLVDPSEIPGVRARGRGPSAPA